MNTLPPITEEINVPSLETTALLFGIGTLSKQIYEMSEEMMVKGEEIAYDADYLELHCKLLEILTRQLKTKKSRS